MENISQTNTLLSMIYTSDLLRTYFLKDPETALKYYDQLTEEDKQILKKLPSQEINSFADNLKAKACENIVDFYKPLFDVYKKQMRELFSDFYLFKKLSPNELIKSYALDFGHFLKLRLYNVKPRHLLDVVTFLTQKCQTSLLDLPPLSYQQESLTRKSKPCLAPNVTIQCYRNNMIQLINNIDNKETTSAGNFYYMMQSTRGKLKIFRITEVGYYFLERCFGFYTIEDLALMLADKFSLEREGVKEFEETYIPSLLRKHQIYFK